MARDVSVELVEAVARLAVPNGIRGCAAAINGCLLRWPDDAAFLEIVARRIGGGQKPGEALRQTFVMEFGALLDALDGLPQDQPHQYARQLVGFCGLDGQGAWLPLPQRIAAVNVALSRAAEDPALTSRIGAIEGDGCHTSVAVVRAVAEVLAARWAQMPPPAPGGPGTAAYRARLKAEIDADLREIALDLRWMDRLIEKDRAEKACTSLAETPAAP